MNQPKNESTNHHPLAGRWSRLGAKVIDVLVLVSATAIAFGILLLGDAFIGIALVVLLMSLPWMVGVLALQVVWLAKDGRTIGKKALGIRVVSSTSGLNAGLVKNVAQRGWLNAVLSIIPFYALVDVLFIFRSDKRCIHDRIASTQVVQSADQMGG